DENALKPFVPLYHGKPAVVGGYCHCGSSDDVSIIVAGLARYAESSAIIFHEYAHLLVHTAVRDVPVWLNEGLAEYYSTFALKNGGRQADIGRPIARHVQLLRERLLPVAQLLAVDQTSALYNEGERRSIFYAESWALTHYLLMERPNGASIVNRYLTAVAAGTPSEKAFVDATSRLCSPIGSTSTSPSARGRSPPPKPKRASATCRCAWDGSTKPRCGLKQRPPRDPTSRRRSSRSRCCASARNANRTRGRRSRKRRRSRRTISLRSTHTR
ncbi:MAG: hypothetical protein DMG03_04295, partial [Acidobacteria bacterium]